MARMTQLGRDEVVNLLMDSPVTVCEWMQKGMLHVEVASEDKRRLFNMSDVAKIARDYGLQFNRPDNGRLRILIVNDNARAAHRLVELLDTLTETAESMPVYSVFDAVQKIPRFQPDLVLVDVNSSYHETVEMCRQIKSEHATRHVRVITVSKSFNREYKQRMLMAGVDLCLERPLSNERLLEVMGLHLDPISHVGRYIGISSDSQGVKDYQS
ncbi:MAG: response regulator [Gammaproteobacteria bacterium]